MANELLDFVMSLVRDPAGPVAARYAQDPAGALADANLTDVTSTDVNNLIPMVADSLSMAAPSFGVGDFAEPGGLALDAPDVNVWTSGAATAAFDSFAAHVPETGLADLPDVAGVIDPELAQTAGDVASGLGVSDLDLSQSVPLIEDPAQFSGAADTAVDALGADDPADWGQGLDSALDSGLDASEPAHDQSGFDLF